ncbi:MAG: hypothetical protein NTX31_00335 [Burkholderiales bacterium]|nr:hypothetical protein [Burkholderiales bacterium]
MKFEDIKFFERSGPKASGFGLYTGGYWVPRDFFVEAWTMILASSPTLTWHGKQTTVTLCSDPGWKERHPVERQTLGRAVKYFVVNEVLDLEEANKGKGGPRRYNPLTDKSRLPEIHLGVVAANIRNQGVTDRSPSAIEI